MKKLFVVLLLMSASSASLDAATFHGLVLSGAKATVTRGAKDVAKSAKRVYRLVKWVGRHA